MSISLIQTDLPAVDGMGLGCSVGYGGIIAPGSGTAQISKNGVAGSTPITITTPVVVSALGDDFAAIVFETPVGEPGIVPWLAGDFTVKLNITTANTNVLWNSVYICQVDKNGNVVSTLGSAVGLNLSLSLGVKTATVAVASVTASNTDRIYIVLGFNTSAKTQTFAFTPNQTLTSPIVCPCCPPPPPSCGGCTLPSTLFATVTGTDSESVALSQVDPITWQGVFRSSCGVYVCITFKANGDHCNNCILCWTYNTTPVCPVNSASCSVSNPGCQVTANSCVCSPLSIGFPAIQNCGSGPCGAGSWNVTITS